MNITGGKYNGRVLKAPDSSIVRPTLSKVRMSVFNVLYSQLGNFENRRFLDLFAGSGIMGLEALSRGFSEVTAVEKNKSVYSIIKSNYEKLNLSAKLILGDSVKVLDRLTDKYDVIYIDPPYLSGIYESVLKKLPLFEIAVVEHSIELDFSDFEIVQSKNYGGKMVTYLKMKSC